MAGAVGLSPSPGETDGPPRDGHTSATRQPRRSAPRTLILKLFPVVPRHGSPARGETSSVGTVYIHQMGSDNTAVGSHAMATSGSHMARPRVAPGIASQGASGPLLSSLLPSLQVPRKPRPPPRTSAPGVPVQPWLQVVGKCRQLAPRVDAQPRAAFLAFLHVQPCGNNSVTTSPAALVVKRGLEHSSLRQPLGTMGMWERPSPGTTPDAPGNPWLLHNTSWCLGGHQAGGTAPAPSQKLRQAPAPHPDQV